MTARAVCTTDEDASAATIRDDPVGSNWGCRSDWLRRVVAGGVGVRAPWPVGPLLEPGAAAVIGEPDDPQVAILLAGWISIADLGPDHRHRAVDGNDVCGQGEDLVRAFSFLLPHLLDRVQASDGLLVRDFR
jgi:hypothetical protein